MTEERTRFRYGQEGQLTSKSTVTSGGGANWGNIFTGTLLIGIITFLIVGIPVGTAAAKLFGGGSTLFWVVLGIVLFLVVVKRRF